MSNTENGTDATPGPSTSGPVSENAGHPPIVVERVFNDPVHGHIELHPLLVKIIDTPQFQRLRNIKQLGGCYFVFPGAAHNRFEHSIGTSHLAGQLAESLQKRQPELNITKEDVLCVRIAGLCHDLGHGPFSHLFDRQFIPEVLPDSDWKHETASVDMFHHIVEKNDLKNIKFKDNQLDIYQLGDQDMLFIEELFAGPKKTNIEEDPHWPYKGRPESKSFLYEIIANKRTGIDVDKWDYFSRDCHNLGIKNSFDHNRYIKMTRVIKVEEEMQICVRDKEVGNIYEMFHTRLLLWQRAYQHKTTNLIEIMIFEALVKANDHLKIKGENGVTKKMSEAIYDMEAYTNLTDNVYYQILYSTENELEPARELLQRIEKRELYKFIGIAVLKNRRDNTDDICSELVNYVDGDPLKDDIIIDLVDFDYGMKDQNPIDKLRFYSKDNPNEAITYRKDQVSIMLPECFSEQHMRVYCRNSDKDVIKKLQGAFKEWVENEKNRTTEVSILLPKCFSEQNVRVYCRNDKPDMIQELKTAFEEWGKKWQKQVDKPQVEPENTGDIAQ